jgi:hypothetical protein
VVHKLPGDLRKALITNITALAAWKDITPLGRNEFICWVEDAKQEMTRERRIRRTQEELVEGQRRPSWWRASAGPAAGRGVSTGTEMAGSGRRLSVHLLSGRRRGGSWCRHSPMASIGSGAL